MVGTTTFQDLRLSGWRQVAAVNIEFHSRLTVITGENGTGKSTILNILARHYGAERPYLGLPKVNDDGALSYLTGVFDAIRGFRKSINRLLGSISAGPQQQIGSLKYSNGAAASILVPPNGNNYSLEIQNQQTVAGLHIPSHRLLTNHQPIGPINLQGIDPDHVYSMFIGEMNNAYRGGFGGRSVLSYMKEALANWAVVGEGNKTLRPNSKQAAAYKNLIDTLKKVLPPHLGFETLEIRAPEIVAITRTGEFLIDAASGGLTALIELTAVIWAFSIRPDLKNDNFVVSIDEPENHLHPSLQRSLMPRLIEAFPKAQFVIATHSPFMVSSVKDSNVFVLKYEIEEAKDSAIQKGERRVVSEKLDYINRAGTASEILREVLGVGSTLPIWVEEELNRILKRYKNFSITDTALSSLHMDLQNAGLSDFYPDAIAGLARPR